MSEVPKCPTCGTTMGYVEVLGAYDGALYLQCPVDGVRAHRFPEGHYLRAKAEKYVNRESGDAL